MSRQNQRGVVMIFTFAILIALISIATGFVFMITTQTVGSGGSTTSSQAIWLADAGIHQVLYQLKNDSSFRSSPTSPVTGSLGAGTYSCTVSKSSNTYTLASTGTVDGLSRAIGQTVLVTANYPDAYSYAIYGDTNASTLQLKNNVVISGNLYYDGAVSVDSGAGVTSGSVYSDSVSGSGTYTYGGAPNASHTYPTFDSSSYDNAIATADSTATSDWTLSGSSSYALNGTLTYKKVTIKDNATITGSGTIVATKDVVIEDDAIISPNITIITKADLTVQDDAVVQSGGGTGVLYGRNSVTLEDGATVTGAVLCPTSGKTVTVQNNANFTGIIYANILKLRDDAVITGSLVADSYTSNKITDDVRVTYSAAARPSTIPTGIPEASPTVTPNLDWDETT